MEYSHQLYAILLACMEQAPQTEGEKEALRAFVEQIAKKSERVTLQSAIRTWAELEKLTALPVASFIRQHTTRVRAFNGLKWLVKNLNLPLDLFFGGGANWSSQS